MNIYNVFNSNFSNVRFQSRLKNETSERLHCINHSDRQRVLDLKKTSQELQTRLRTMESLNLFRDLPFGTVLNIH